MTLAELIDATRLQLRRNGRVTNAHLLEQCPPDEAPYWLRQVRDTLLFEGLAEDDNQLGLRLIPADQRPPEREYDVFISYARKDNAIGRIDEIYRQMSRRFFQNSGRVLRIFYDRHDIKGGDDWARRLADGLRQSKIMVAVLSPNYFNSEWCEKEWAEFYQQEIGLSSFEEGIAPVYVIRMPEFLEVEGQQLTDWKRDLRKRQLLDFTDWYEEGETALIRDDIEQRFGQLDELCFKRLDRIEQVRKSRHNLPRHFRQFFGREDDIRQIHTHLNREQPPVVALWGMAGIGKSTLAVEYGLAFADRYAGGRFLIPAANLTSILSGLKDLMIREFDWTFTDDENKDDERAYARIRHHFADAARQNANHLALLIFDNVDEPDRLFAKAELLRLPEGVHILLTTRQRTDGDASGLLVGQPVGELSEGASVRLLGSYRPFADDTDKQTAGAIAHRLGGYALALNVAGVFLEKTPDYPYTRLLQGLAQSDVRMLDQMGRLDEVDLYNYSTKVVSELFAPLLAGLTPAQRRAVDYAALLPPDAVPLPWLETLVLTDFPDLAANPNDPFVLVTPWESLVRELKRLSIWTETPEPKVVSMHRVLQGLVREELREEREELEEKLYELVEERANDLVDNWHHKEARWEISPLVDFTKAALLAYHAQAIRLSNRAWQPLRELGLYTDARELLEQALMYNTFQQNATEQGALYCNMATIQRDLGKLAEAKEWLRKSIATDEANYEPTHPNLGIRYSNMALIQRDLGEPIDAEKWMKKSLVIDQANYHPADPNLGISYSNMALIKQDLGKLLEAEVWMLTSITIDEANHPPNYPKLGVDYSNMAMIQQDLGKLAEAEKWLRKSIPVFEANYEPTSPHMGTLYSNMAAVQQGLGRLEEAETYMHKSIAIDESNYEPNHLQLGIRYSNMSLIQKDLGRLMAAEASMKKSIAIGEANYESTHPVWGVRYSNMAMIQLDLGKLADAEGWIKKSIAIAEANYEPIHPTLGIFYSNLAKILGQKGEREQACQLWLKAYKILQKSLGEHHPHTNKVQNHLRQHCPECFE